MAHVCMGVPCVRANDQPDIDTKQKQKRFNSLGQRTQASSLATLARSSVRLSVAHASAKQCDGQQAADEEEEPRQGGRAAERGGSIEQSKAEGLHHPRGCLRLTVKPSRYATPEERRQPGLLCGEASFQPSLKPASTAGTTSAAARHVYSREHTNVPTAFLSLVLREVRTNEGCSP
jgi:hypothetical protein